MWNRELIFHHVGIGVLDLEAAVQVYEALGHRRIVVADDPSLKVRVAFLGLGLGAPLIELLAPLGEKGPLSSLVKRGILPSPYHTGYVVDDIGPASAELVGFGFRSISDSAVSTTLGGALIMFFYHPTVGLVELVQGPSIGPNRTVLTRK